MKGYIIVIEYDDYRADSIIHSNVFPSLQLAYNQMRHFTPDMFGRVVIKTVSVSNLSEEKEEQLVHLKVCDQFK